ncbi:uncharacterized protein B0T15DRAFT_18727 [Chaetomium strumarium]|uniref:Uncharacterized protein n=1 Tax=Chaetomium strumarium TaxID=1170767 RepID=A0AAJ0H166_9PEZI|nr:hypothetical protein B0T15DRAFT_18727 [Chaetomium strumarium]
MYDRPVEQIFTEYTIKCTRDNGNLDILSDVEDSSLRTIPGLPSWVPGFSFPLTLTQWLRGRQARTKVSNRHLGCQGGWSAQNGGADIALAGCPIGGRFALASKESAAENMIIHQLQEWAAMIEPMPADYPSGCHKALIRDRGDEDQYPAPVEYGDYYETLQELIQLNQDLDRRIESGEDGGAAARILCQGSGIHPADLPRLMAESAEF